MWLRIPEDAQEGFYLAGELAPPGLYQRVGGGEPVRLISTERLPASLDGRVACYTRLHTEWRIASEAGSGISSDH